MTARHSSREAALARLQVSRSALARALAGVPSDRRQERPSPERWSAAEVLEHQARVEGSVTRLLARGAQAPPSEPSSPAVPLDEETVADRSRRIETTEKARPTRGLAAEATWEELTAARERLLEVVGALDDATLGRVRAPHFVFGVLDGVGWLRFLAGHEERHAGQIEEAAGALAARGSPAPAVVLDTNVVVAAAFRPGSDSARLVAAAREGRVRPVWSDETRRETEHVVGKIPVLSGAALEGLFPERNRHVPAADTPPFEEVPDPEDRKFARLAASAGATLVTMDEHLLGVRGTLDVAILTPAGFLRGGGNGEPRGPHRRAGARGDG